MKIEFVKILKKNHIQEDLLVLRLVFHVDLQLVDFALHFRYSGFRNTFDCLEIPSDFDSNPITLEIHIYNAVVFPFWKRFLAVIELDSLEMRANLFAEKKKIRPQLIKKFD